MVCAVALVIPVVASEAVAHAKAVAAERSVREQYLSDQRARENRAIQLRMQASADSARRSLPSSQLRRAKMANLRAAVHLVGNYRADSAQRWLAAARAEITRREKAEAERLRLETLKRERNLARSQAAEARAYTPRSSAASRGYFRGPRGGCYTYSGSGRKRYVARSLCD